MIKYLEWDSNFLGFRVGSISQLNTEILEHELGNAKLENYKLIYLFAEADCFLPENLLQKYKGKLVDRKVLYAQKLFGQPIDDYDQTNLYTSPEVSDDLLQLAYESGKYSRFKLDKNLTPRVFTDMYKLWIENSVNGQMADRIYVVERNNKMVAMVTLRAKSDTLHIGLIATALESQGKGYGKQLINRTKQTAIEFGLKYIEVPTQYDNNQACHFYKACGFQIKSITNIYHFWL
jgi:dTDP-4-amino-4,6-dideoxy-D-galactose acyltransferase